jgi:ABC-type branched-subunit amino acid transport system substrate-binding protein
MSKRRGARGILVALAVLVVAAGCGGGRGNSSSGTTAAANGAATTPSSSSGKFGTIASPCGPGSAKGATDRGVTDTSIHIGYGDDRGFAGSPGLNKEMGDAVKAMIKWCNDQGGVEGRQVVGDFYDAAITQTPTVMQQACSSDFMLVGEGWALDDSAEQIRVGCNLVAVPGFAVGPNFANGPMMYQAVPNPDDYIPGAPYFQMAQLFPTQIKKADLLHTTLSATETSNAKAVEGMQAAGWNVLNCGVKINYSGEPDYKPFAQQFQSCGITLLFNNTSPGPVLYNFIQAMDQVGVKPIILGEANVYTAAMAAWNTQGLGNNIYVRESFQPLENSAQIPAVKAYLDAVKATGGDVSQLGAQAASSFLLWATEAKACGSNLTRQCMVNNLSKVHNWTGGGLHASGDPGKNLPPQCGVLIKLTGTTWSQYYPKTIGQYDCNPKYLFKVSEANWGTTLGPDRIATKFLTPNVIKPQQ